MNYAALRAFHHVVENGSMTRAAAALGVSQPTLSGQVKSLHMRHGVKLLERSGRGLEPTERGRALYELTRQYFAVEDQIDQFFAQVHDPGRTRLRLGADAPTNIIPALAALSARYPRMRLSLSFGNGQAVMSDLLDRRCDVAVIPEPPRDKRLFAAPLRDDRLVALVPRDHAWAKRQRARLIELAFQPVVLREPGSRTRAVLQRALERTGVALIDELEIGSREGVIEAVAAGLGVGVTFLSEYRSDPRLAAIRLTGAPTTSREYVACLAARRGAPAIEAFIKVALELAKRSAARR